MMDRIDLDLVKEARKNRLLRGDYCGEDDD